MRTLEYYNYDDMEWQSIEWPTVTSGMMIRVFEEDGTQIPSTNGVYELKAVSDAYEVTISGEGTNWGVDITDDPNEFTISQ